MAQDICAVFREMENKSPFLFKEKKEPINQVKFLLDGNMKGQYLGACLDSCRWGSETTVMYMMGIRGMRDFIKSWMQQNEDNFQTLFRPEELGYKELALPHIHYESCPRDSKHKGTIEDIGGRLRCAQITTKYLKPSFIESFEIVDGLSGIRERCFYEKMPSNPVPNFAFDSEGLLTPECAEIYGGEYKEYLHLSKLFEEEEPTFVANDICYAILSDERMVLPLETVLKRLNLRPLFTRVSCQGEGCKRLDELDEPERGLHRNTMLCPGHIEPHNKVEFCFSGWTLASYVQKWYEQLPNGAAPWFEDKKQTK